MLRLIVPAIALLIAAPAVADTRSYPFKDFSKLDISSVYDVEFVQGSKFSVEVDSQYGDFNYIIVEKVGDTLRITRPNGTYTKPLHDVVRITAPSLKEISVSAAVTFRTDALKAPDLKLNVESGSRFTASGLKADSLLIHADTGGVTTLDGACNTAFIRASLGAPVRAGDLSCNKVGIEASGGAPVSVQVKDNVTAVAKGGAVIRVAGNPAVVDKYADSSSVVSFRH